MCAPMTRRAPPHHADPAHLEDELRRGRSFFERHGKRALRGGDDLHKRLIRSRDLLGPAAVSGRDDEVLATLRGVARSVAAQLSLIRAPARPVELDAGGQVHELSGNAAADLLHLTDWLDAFHAALALRDQVALGLLLAVPDELWNDGREAPVWRKSVDLLRSLYLGTSEGDPAAAARALHDEAEKGLTPDVRGLAEADLQPLLATWAVVLGGGDLDATLSAGLAAHGAFWSHVEEVDRRRGYVALWLLGVACQAWDRGLRTQLDTPYLPAVALRSSAPTLVLACPYCVTPMDPEREQCAGCFQDPRRDAAFELTLDELAVRKARCPHCDFPLHELAVRCGRCAQPMR